RLTTFPYTTLFRSGSEKIDRLVDLQRLKPAEEPLIGRLAQWVVSPVSADHALRLYEGRNAKITARSECRDRQIDKARIFLLQVDQQAAIEIDQSQAFLLSSMSLSISSGVSRGPGTGGR